MRKRRIGFAVLAAVLCGGLLWADLTDRRCAILYNRNDASGGKSRIERTTVISPHLIQRIDCAMKRGS